MLKSLNKNDTLNTPFTTTKDWHLSNNENNDLILFEHTASDGSDIAVAVEYIDYGDGSTLQPFINTSCSLANENQSLNLATYNEGKKIGGLFFPDTDPQNLDHTYKRLIFSQIRGMFYNNYRDPTKIWGMEELDFEKSQTKKFLTDKFVVFTVLPNIMGEKILPNTVEFIDNSSDNEYSITDDGNTNLFIGKNVFSKQQELGKFGNFFTTGSDGTCNNYFNLNPPEPPNLTGSFISLSANFATGSLNWQSNNNNTSPILGSFLEKSLDGINYTILSFFNPTTSSTFDFPLSQNVTYYYRINDLNQFGSSSYSNVVTITPLLPEWPGNFVTTSFGYVSGQISFGPPWEVHSGGFLNNSASFNVSASNLALNTGGDTLYTGSAFGTYTGPATTASLYIDSTFFFPSPTVIRYGKVQVTQSGVGVFDYTVPHVVNGGSGDNNPNVTSSFILSGGVNTPIQVNLIADMDVFNTTRVTMVGKFHIP